MARIHAFFHNFRQVIDIIEKNIIQLGYFRFNITRHRQIDDKYRAMFARFNCAFYHTLA